MRKLAYVLLILLMVYCGMREAILELQIPMNNGPDLLMQVTNWVLLWNDPVVNYGVAVGSFVVLAAMRQIGSVNLKRVKPSQLKAITELDGRKKEIIHVDSKRDGESVLFKVAFPNVKFKEVKA